MAFRIEIARPVADLTTRMEGQSFAATKRLALAVLIARLGDDGLDSTEIQTDPLSALTGRKGAPLYSSRLSNTTLPMTWAIRWYFDPDNSAKILVVDAYLL